MALKDAPKGGLELIGETIDWIGWVGEQNELADVFLK